MNRRKFLQSSLFSLAGWSLNAFNPPPVSAADIAPSDDKMPPICVDYGSLTLSQRNKLRRAALGWLADTHEEAHAHALRLGYLEGNNESPSSMAGPLALNFLLEAGLIDRQALADQLKLAPDSVLKSMWLMNPVDPERRKVMQRVLPKETHQLIVIDLPADKVNFARQPLVPGDLVYSRGSNGGVDHIFLVTEVDSAGRAWTVTNLPTGTDNNESLLYAVKRGMLYDPSYPGEGLLTDWLNPARSPLLQTGQRGYLIYRFKSQNACPGGSCTDLETALNRVLTIAGGNWHIRIREFGQPRDLYQRGKPHEPIHPASLIKVPIAMLFLYWVEENMPDLQKYLDTGPAGQGISYRQLLEQMLVLSNETASDTLVKFLYDHYGQDKIKEILTGWGAPATSIEPRKSTMGDLFTLLEGLWSRRMISPAASDLILDWMKTQTSGDRGRIWAYKEVLDEEDFTIWNKRGSLASANAEGTGLVIVSDMGVVRVKTSGKPRTFLIFLHAIPEKGIAPFPYQQSYEELEATAGELIRAFATKL